MLLSHPLIITSVILVFLGLILLIIALVGMRKRKLSVTAAIIMAALLIFSLSALFLTISIASQGYHALTGEECAATVKVEPVGEQKFNARFSMPDGNEQVFSLAGDQLHVEAHILRWKALASLFGPRISYELDQVAGRQAISNNEKPKALSVYSLSYEKPLNMFDLRKRFVPFALLLDAESAPAMVISANTPEEFRVMISPTGLLMRKIEKEAGK
jgi:hypothetical protein